MDARAIFWGFSIALGTLLVLGAVFAVVFYYFTTNLTWWTVFALVVIFLSLVSGGYVAGRKAQKKGLWHGLWVSILFIIFFLILSFTVFHTPFSLITFLEKSFIMLLAGAIGGIIGVSIF